MDQQMDVASRAQQMALPTLPVPRCLQKACEVYLNFLEPILEVEELKRTREVVEEFQKEGGVGESLQRGLETRALATENWFSNIFVWREHLKQRIPLVIHKSFGMLFPRADFRDKQGQIRYAAELISAALEFKTKTDNETLPVEYMRGKPLCMKQYKDMMSSCRVPGLEKDSLEFYDHKHITVVHKCQFFVLDVYNSDRTPLTVDQLCVQLEAICSSSLQTNTAPVGILTTENRDVWSKSYTELLKDKTNKESVSAIQSSMFTVCLDGAMPPVSEEKHRSSAILQILHGGGSQWNSANRWFDKGLQLIIGEDGTCGVNVCHVTADATVGMGFSDSMVEYMKKRQVKQSPVEPLPVPQKLHFNLTPDTKKDIEEAQQHLDILVQDLELSTLTFDHFGKNVLKALKVSPDAFVQMAVQLAYYRTHQQMTRPMMENISQRMFRLGRLAFINSISPASAAFVKAFDDPDKQSSEKLDLLEKAIKAHVSYTNMAIRGESSEIHLWGLMDQAIQEEIPMPGIFMDPSIYRSIDYGLWGTQISSKNGCLPCVGADSHRLHEVVYNNTDDHMDFTVANYKSSNPCKESLVGALEAALLDVKNLLEQTSTDQV